MAAAQDLTSLPEMLDLDALIDDIRRYLDAVDAFRREGHEPRWQEDLTSA